MRIAARIVGVLMALYMLACLLSLVVAAIGIVGTPGEPLAAVYALLVAMPWPLLIGTPSGAASPVGNFLLLILFMTVNIGLLWLLRRALLRSGSRQ